MLAIYYGKNNRWAMVASSVVIQMISTGKGDREADEAGEGRREKVTGRMKRSGRGREYICEKLLMTMGL